MKSFAALLLLAVVPWVCAQDKMQASPHGKSAMASPNFKAMTQKMADEWKAAYQAKDIDKVAAMYSSDAIWVTAEGTFHGPSEIKAELKKQLDRGDTVESILTTKTTHFAGIAYAEGTFSGQAPGKEGSEGPVSGSWVVTLRNDNGKWMLVSHTSVPGGMGSMGKGMSKP
jgi:ketosteroid isomerase-like protein